MMPIDPLGLRALYEPTLVMTRIQDGEEDQNKTESGSAISAKENLMNPLGETFIVLEDSTSR